MDSKEFDLIKRHLIDLFSESSVFDIDGVSLVIDNRWKKIAVSLSGGADSALLCYLLCKNILEKNLSIEIHIISNVRMWKDRPWQKYNSIDVFNFLKNRFSTINFVRHGGYIAPELEWGNKGPLLENSLGIKKSGDQIITSSFTEYICFIENIDAWFAAKTKNPDIDTISKKMPDRNDSFKGSELNKLSLAYKNNQTFFLHPLNFITKDWVIKQYIDNNLLDLLSITRSCEGDNKTYPEIFKGIDYRSYVSGQKIPECGKCFWCQERKWAFSKNGIYE